MTAKILYDLLADYALDPDRADMQVTIPWSDIEDIYPVDDEVIVIKASSESGYNIPGLKNVLELRLGVFSEEKR